jgi:hypothetical protein
VILNPNNFKDLIYEQSMVDYTIALDTYAMVVSQAIAKTANNHITSLKASRASKASNKPHNIQYQELETWLIKNSKECTSWNEASKKAWGYLWQEQETIFKSIKLKNGKKFEVNNIEWYYRKTLEIHKRMSLQLKPK